MASACVDKRKAGNFSDFLLAVLSADSGYSVV